MNINAIITTVSTLFYSSDFEHSFILPAKSNPKNGPEISSFGVLGQELGKNDFWNSSYKLDYAELTALV